MSSFKTRSTARKSVLAIVYTYIPMFLLAFLGLKIAMITWLYLESMLLLVFAFCLFLVSKTHWEIELQGNNISLVNTGNRQSYYIENLTQSYHWQIGLERILILPLAPCGFDTPYLSLPSL